MISESCKLELVLCIKFVDLLFRRRRQRQFAGAWGRTEVLCGAYPVYQTSTMQVGASVASTFSPINVLHAAYLWRPLLNNCYNCCNIWKSQEYVGFVNNFEQHVFGIETGRGWGSHLLHLPCSSRVVCYRKNNVQENHCELDLSFYIFKCLSSQLYTLQICWIVTFIIRAWRVIVLIRDDEYCNRGVYLATWDTVSSGIFSFTFKHPRVIVLINYINKW